MTSSVSITVVIPTYGRDRVLVDTIRHVLALVPPPAEVIVLDQTKEHAPEVVRTLEGMASLGSDSVAALARATDSTCHEPRPN